MSNHLQRRLLEAAPLASLVNCVSAEWQSVTFSGHRHQITLAFPNEQAANHFIDDVRAERLTVNLTDRTTLCDLLVVDSHENTVTVEALTLND